MTDDTRLGGRIRRRRVPTFYERALSASDQALFDDALEVEGMDAEVVLLRMHILRLLDEHHRTARRCAPASACS